MHSQKEKRHPSERDAFVADFAAFCLRAVVGVYSDVFFENVRRWVTGRKGGARGGVINTKLCIKNLQRRHSSLHVVNMMNETLFKHKNLILTLIMFSLSFPLIPIPFSLPSLSLVEPFLSLFSSVF